MQNPNTSTVAAKLISGLLFSVTVIVYTGSVTDPVNAPKLTFLGILSFAVLGVLISGDIAQLMNKFKIQLLLLSIFFIASIGSFISSSSPLSQQLYGVYGRNNGFLLYLSLIFLFAGSLVLQKVEHFRWIVIALFAAGAINLFYGLWTVAFGDFIGWTNPYGNLLGTLGNPNFAGSFFGMFGCVLFAGVLSPDIKRNLKLLLLALIPVNLFCILQTEAVQGKVLFAVGLGIATFFYLRSKFASWIFPSLYLGFSGILSLSALLGALQIGPLAKFIYKTSVSLRGEYWHAGLVTGMSNPLFGVGFDGYGDWYRRSRRESALSLPGVDTVTNTAHNVYLDIFSFGGWPLLLSYSLLNLLVMVSIVRVTLRQRNYDSIFVVITSAWICYQLQSIISINQVGLAIWGWALGGAIIAYEQFLKSKQLATREPDKSLRRKNQEIVTPWLRAGVMSVIGLLVALPPLTSDIKWRQAQDSRDAGKLERVLSPSYLNPINSFAFNNIVGVFETSNLPELAHTYALQGIKFNPDNFDSWKNLYLISLSTQEEKELAVSNMKRLDPLNPNLGKLSE